MKDLECHQPLGEGGEGEDAAGGSTHRTPWAQAGVGCLPVGLKPQSHWPGCSGCRRDGWVGDQAPSWVTPCCSLQGHQVWMGMEMY